VLLGSGWGSSNLCKVKRGKRRKLLHPLDDHASVSYSLGQVGRSEWGKPIGTVFSCKSAGGMKRRENGRLKNASREATRRGTESEPQLYFWERAKENFKNRGEGGRTSYLFQMG